MIKAYTFVQLLTISNDSKSMNSEQCDAVGFQNPHTIILLDLAYVYVTSI